MLTPTDTHYLVGLLSQLTHPDNVEVELGSMVYDQTTKSLRDVDVTINVVGLNNERTVFKAVEVKALGRKVGSEIVEQLAQKLNDMPSVDRKAIVSASGFTRPATRKAEAHHVELFELREWSPQDDLNTFGHVLSRGVFVFYQWLAPVQVRLNPGAEFNDDERALIRSNPLVSFPDKPLEAPRPLLDWLACFKSITAASLQTRVPDPSSEGIFVTDATVTCAIQGMAVIQCDDIKIGIERLRFSGRFEKKSVSTPSTFKALYPIGSRVPLAGCCVSILPNESLMSLAITRDKRVQLGSIPLSERNIRRLYRKRFGSDFAEVQTSES